MDLETRFRYATTPGMKMRVEMMGDTFYLKCQGMVHDGDLNIDRIDYDVIASTNKNWVKGGYLWLTPGQLRNAIEVGNLEFTGYIKGEKTKGERLPSNRGYKGLGI